MRLSLISPIVENRMNLYVRRWPDQYLDMVFQNIVQFPVAFVPRATLMCFLQFRIWHVREIRFHRAYQFRAI